MYKINDKKSIQFLHVSSKQLGVTLVELLITVAIIGILAGVAYPSYTDYVTRSNRSEAQRELLRLANLQEQVFVDTRAYASDMKGLGFSTVNFKRESENYVIKVTAASTASTFTLKAIAKKVQLNDTGCTGMKVTHLGVKTPAACWER